MSLQIGRTPLMGASATGRTRIVSALITAGADVNARANVRVLDQGVRGSLRIYMLLLVTHGTLFFCRLEIRRYISRQSTATVTQQIYSELSEQLQ